MLEQAPVLQACNLWLSYGDTQALAGVDLSLVAGESLALMGPSGSGKSSLLHCLAGVLKPDSGEVWAFGRRIDALSEAARSALRLERLGMVFQFANLVSELTLLENVMLPLQLLGASSKEASTRAHELLELLEVDQVSGRRAGAVSGGQAQRAAVARALVHRPAVVFADEPTGALDSVNADKVLDALLALAEHAGSTVVLVTHENRVAAHCQRLVTMLDGRITEKESTR
ncbi:MAG: ABC transporter ATP-binding protein [Actinomycetota bacterium]|nr:ABC transporter ATP-binding protein [Actinomycetota bacterium]